MFRTYLAALAASPLVFSGGQAMAQELSSTALANSASLPTTPPPALSEATVAPLLVAPTAYPTKLSLEPTPLMDSRGVTGKASQPFILRGPGFSETDFTSSQDLPHSAYIAVQPEDFHKPFGPTQRYIAAPWNDAEKPLVGTLQTDIAPAVTQDEAAIALPALAVTPQEVSDTAVIVPVQVETPAAPDAATTTDAEMQARLDKLQERLDKAGTDELAPVFLVLPSISSNVPNAYGAGAGMYAFGFGYQNRLRYTDHKKDGTMAVLVGLSDPRKLGVDIQLNALDLSRFGHRTAIGFKLHRQLGHDYAIAFGGENALIWPDSDSNSSYYLVLSKKLRLAESSSEPFSRVYLSAGIGTGRYRKEGDIFDERGHVNLFGSAAVNVSKSTNAFAEWTGQSLNVGASILPLRNYPFIVTLAMSDIAGEGGDGSRFTAGFGYVLPR